MSAHAATEVFIPGLEFLQVPANADIGQLLTTLYIWGLGFVALSAFGAFTYGGLRYMTAGDSDPSEAKTWMKNAVYGLLLALGSYLILYTINPDLVNVKITDLPPITAPNTSSTPGSSTSPVPDRSISEIKAVCTATSSVDCESDTNCERPRIAGIPTGDCRIKQSLLATIQAFCVAQRDTLSCRTNVNCEPVLNPSGDFTRCRLK